MSYPAPNIGQVYPQGGMMKRILIVAALAVPAVVGSFGFPSWADTSGKLVVTGAPAPSRR